MPETFKCPTCAAPLKFEGKTLQPCDYCGAQIIVPPEMFQKKEIHPQPKVIRVDEILKNVFSNPTGGRHYVIDLRNPSRQVQQNMQIVHTEINAGHHSNAVDVFTQTFGFNSNDAEKAVSEMERGRGVDISKMRLYPEVPQKSQYGWVIKLVIGFVVLMFLLPFVGTILMFLLMYLLQ